MGDVERGRFEVIEHALITSSRRSTRIRLGAARFGSVMAPTSASSVSANLSRFWMRRTRLLYAIVVSLWSAVVACSQAMPPMALSGAVRAHVKDERFQSVASLHGLPVGVLFALENLFGSQTLDIAEPAAEFQVTSAIVHPTLPRRRLVAAGCSIQYCLVYYERGGIAHTWHVAMFSWTPAATRFEWGGTAPAGLTTIEDVRNAILSGAIRGPANVW